MRNRVNIDYYTDDKNAFWIKGYVKLVLVSKKFLVLETRGTDLLKTITNTLTTESLSPRALGTHTIQSTGLCHFSTINRFLIEQSTLSKIQRV